MNKKILLSGYLLLLFCFFVSCYTQKKSFMGHYKIINYVFHDAMDSVLTTYFDQLNKKIEPNDFFIKFSREITDTNYSKISDEYAILYKRNHSKKYRHSDESNLDLIISRTNRYIALNQGKYCIPLIFDFDTIFFKCQNNDSNIDTVKYTKIMTVYATYDWHNHKSGAIVVNH